MNKAGWIVLNVVVCVGVVVGIKVAGKQMRQSHMSYQTTPNAAERMARDLADATKANLDKMNENVAQVGAEFTEVLRTGRTVTIRATVGEGFQIPAYKAGCAMLRPFLEVGVRVSYEYYGTGSKLSQVVTYEKYKCA